MIKEFFIDDAYLTSVTTVQTWSMYQNKTDLTPEELVKVIKGEDKCSMTSSHDHPEFDILRNKLSELGYVQIERGWWNGDRVLKRFKLNGYTFSKGDQFPCGAALGTSISCAKKFGWKKLV